jgi:predicted DNA binding CopG/RHH family protein
MKSVKMKAKKTSTGADDWVANRTLVTTENKEAVKMKRLTIDVPESLHTRIKTQCAGKGLIMADEIRELLDKKFPEQT